MRVIESSISGKYQLIGDIHEADCVIGQSFGACEHEPGLVNGQLANYIASRAIKNLPLLLQSEIAESLPDSVRRPALVINGQPSVSMGGELDTWSVLSQAREYMTENSLNQPLIVAQAYHVGRVALQAMRLDMEPIVHYGYPRDFDPESTQWWTRNLILWSIREVPGIAYLKLKHKL